MSIRACDEFGSDLFKSGFENGVSLDVLMAQNLIEEIEKGGDYPSFGIAREAALSKFLLSGKEREAYTDFLGRVFGRRRRERERVKKEAFARPSPPIEVYEDGH